MFGASAPATTAILTAIFLGIALGSQAAVPFLKKTRNPFTFYAVLELMMGIWGLIIPLLLNFSGQIYVSGVHALGEGHVLQTPLRFVLAILPLLPATLAMGATIPVMIQCIARSGTSRVGLVYGINILGAVVGCLFTGLLGMKLLGLGESRYVAVAFNVVAFFIILPLRKFAHQNSDGPVSNQVEFEAKPISLFAYFCTGFVALGLEVVWLRFLGIVNTNSTVTFTLTLSIYLLGMGFGSLCLYPLLLKKWTPRSIFRLANGGTAIASLLTFGVLYRAAGWNQEYIVSASRSGSLTLSDIYLTEAQIISLLMFLPTMFMGLSYPAVCDSDTRVGDAHDRWVGRSYFWGTLGSVAGIMVVGITLIPLLGLHSVFTSLILMSSMVCLATRGTNPDRLKPAYIPGLVLLTVIWSVWIGVNGRPVLRETLSVRRGEQLLEVSVNNKDQVISEIVRVADGRSATVYTKKNPESQEHLVYVDDQLVASTNIEARVDSLMLAHLPLLLHPDPHNALTVGFGTGGTSFALTTHGVKSYCVEIEPEVPRSAYLMPEQNYSVLDHPDFTLLINDARDHLHVGTRAYDVIATDVTNLQYKQNGNLYTVEYFELMKSSLKPGGIACAWIPMAAIDARELKILMRGFQEVFPHATLWFMNHTHTNFGILIGTPSRLSIDYDRLEEGFSKPEVAKNMELIGMTSPLQLIHCLHLDEDGYRLYCDDVPLHTDDHPILEFSSPLSFYQYYSTFHSNLAETLFLRPQNFSQYVRNLPDSKLDEMEAHRVASHAFCEVILRMYEVILARENGSRQKINQALKEAIQLAEIGMRAWPEDTIRERFYTKFFTDSQRQLEVP